MSESSKETSKVPSNDPSADQNNNSNNGSKKDNSTHQQANIVVAISEEQKSLLEAVQMPPQMSEAQIAYDAINQRYISSIVDYLASNDSDLSNAKEGPQIIFFDSQGHALPAANIDLSDLFAISPQQDLNLVDKSLNINSTTASETETSLGDTLSVLRFLRGNKSKRLEISPSGLTLKYHKASSSKDKKDNPEGEELVLTNMGFYTGLHLWEIICPISCNSMQFGVYNPITKTEFLTSFKTTTPRTVTVCLDLNENLVKFWLNDRRNSGKNIKLTEGGPYVPCIKITQEKNKVILNPFAREPSDFYEKDFDKKFTVRKYVMPHLHNMLCVSCLPNASNPTQASQHLKAFKLAPSEINKILISNLAAGAPQTEEGQSEQNPQRDSFCFLQFHLYETMGEFIRKHQSKTEYKIYQPYEIAEWFEKKQEDLPPDVRDGPFKLIREQIQIPQASQEEAFEIMRTAYTNIVISKQFHKEESKSGQQRLEVIQQSFSDKIILKTDKFMQLASRDKQTLDFDFLLLNLSEPPTHLKHLVTLKIEEKLFSTIFTHINWSSIFKEKNEIVNAFVKDFFQSVSRTAQVLGEGKYIVVRVALDTAKFLIDILIQNMRSQLERVKRLYNNYQTVLPTSNFITQARIKVEQPYEPFEKACLDFYKDPNFSVDDIYQILNTLCDIQEQIWAQAKSQRTHQEVNTFVNTVSRPFSAFNRLGSFICWGSIRTENIIQELADQGFFFRENLTISNFENPAAEISDISESALLSQNYLRDQLGPSNRLLNSLVCDNVPLYKTLNYLAPKTLKHRVLDILTSSNSDFILTGFENGSMHINIATLRHQLRKVVNLFDTQETKNHRMKKQSKIMDTLLLRHTQFVDYNRSLVKKGLPLAILVGGQQKQSSESAGSRTKPEKMGHAIISKKALQAKAKEIKMAANVTGALKKAAKEEEKNKEITQEEEATEIEGLFSDIPEEKKQQIPRSKGLSFALSQECKVLGYILLSAPASMNILEPLIVGCIFFNSLTQKFYLRVKKLSFSINYLQNFLTIDTNSGCIYSKINGKQFLKIEDIQQSSLEILNHQETIFDLYTCFMRTQVFKKDWPKKDYKFSILDEVADAEFAFADCKRIIDFTRTSFAVKVEHQRQVHVIYENQESKFILSQFKIESEEFDKKLNTQPIYIAQSNQIVLDEAPTRVFQYDDKVLISYSGSYHVLKQGDFGKIQDERMCYQVSNPKSMSILNLSDSKDMYCRENMKKFADVEAVPPQDWYLVVNEKNDDLSYHRYFLTERSSVQQNGFKKQITLVSSQEYEEFDLSSVPPSDIIQIGSLLESRQEGLIGVPNTQSMLNSAGIDTDTGLPLIHNWKLLSKPADIKLECKLRSEERDIHLKQIDLEFSFRRKVSKATMLTVAPQSVEVQQSLFDDAIPPQRLPLIVESNTGAQCNDQMYQNILTSPDSEVFCSNYPQPEFIFKLQSNKLFIPTQFVVRSKENRVYNGVPISQGLIFVSNNLEDLFNTRQFSRMTEKELNKWFSERYTGELKSIEALPNEPIVYFNMEEKTEVVLENPLKSSKPVKYVKFIPTGFRKRPINFTSKPFNENQVECQFFGVNGYELAQSLASTETNSNEVIARSYVQSVEASGLQVKVSQADKFVIGQIESVRITELRSAKSNQSSIPISALNHLTIPNVVGVGRVSIGIKENQCNQISDITINLQQFEAPSEWEIQDVSVSVKSYSDRSATFTSEALLNLKPKLRNYLLDISKFDKLLGKLLIIAQDQSQSDQMRVASLQCILNFLKNNIHDKNYSNFLKLFKEKTDIRKLLNDSYIDTSVKYQQISQHYLEKVGVLKSNSDYIAKELITSQIAKLFEVARPIQKVKSVFELLSMCNSGQRQEVQKSLVNLLLNRICNVELPQYQTEEYIKLRSKQGINLFPFDDIYFKNDEQLKESFSNEQSSESLPCRFEVYKLNTFYQYNVDLRTTSKVESLKLHFDHDEHSIYKILVRVMAPNIHTGYEETIYRRVFDENTYFTVCERGHKYDVIKYFKSASSIEDQEGKEDTDQDKLNSKQISNLLNSIIIDLHGVGFTGRFLKIQIDLLDSFKSVHKQQQHTKIFIRPEFFGTQMNQDSTPEHIVQKFKLHEPNQINQYSNCHNCECSIYYMPDEPLSGSQKACLMTFNERKEDPSKEETKKEERSQEEIEKDIKEIEQLRKSLKETVDAGKQPKKMIMNQAAEIAKLTSKMSGQSTKLSLRYLMKLADLFASHIVLAQKANSEILKTSGVDLRALYSTLFKRFTVYDMKNRNKNVQKLLEIINSQLESKTDFIIEIIEEYLLKNHSEISFSQKNVIEFIQSQKQYINFSELIGAVNKSLKLKEGSLESSITDIFNRKIKDEDLKLHSVVAILTILEEVSTNLPEPLENISDYLKLVYSFANNCQSFASPTHSKGLITLKYSLQTLQRLLFNSKPAAIDELASTCQTELTTLIVMAHQRDSDRQLTTLVKEVIFTIANKGTTSGQKMAEMTDRVLAWYKDKTNIQHAQYYKQLDEELEGRGTGVFYKHLSQVFEIYMEVLSLISNGIQEGAEGGNVIQSAYKELGALIRDLLQVLISEQDSENYDKNFFEVWTQIFKTIVYLSQHKLADNKTVELFTANFYSLNIVYQEALYPDFHTIIQDNLDKSNPQSLISVFNSFLTEGMKGNSLRIKLAYCFCDGLINILQTGKKDQQLQTSLHCQFGDPFQVKTLFETLTSFLRQNLNYGVYTGVVGANTELIMKLDLAIQMSSALLVGNLKTGKHCFEAYSLSKEISVADKEKNLTILIQWMILNFSANKSKSSPAGSRIFQLSSNLENILGKLQVSDEAVSICLPILMKTILSADFKLRELIHQSKNDGKEGGECSHLINYERAISIQKTVNTLFLTLFNLWVKTDQVAKKFLTDLNGFDFLLDRLFSKVEIATKKKEETKQIPPASQEEPKKQESNNPGDLLVIGDLFGDDDPNEIFSVDNEEDFLMSLVQQKVELLKEPSGKDKKQVKAPPKKSQGPEPPKTPAVPTEEPDVEQKIQINDFAQNIKLIWSSDKKDQIKAQYATTQWSKFKNGTKNRFYNFVINEKQYNYEYALKFDLDKIVMMNEIQIGVVYNWSTYDPDCNTEPLTILVEGGKEENSVDWRVLLTPAKDDGFSMNSITLFGFNFMNQSQVKETELEKIISKIGSKEARYITFKFRKPLLTCSEQSIYIGQVSKPKSYGISFVSVLGSQIPSSEKLFNFLINSQKENSLEILSKFFSNEFTQTFELISEQESIIEKIKNAFDKLAILMNTKANLIKPIFLALCSKNKTLGNWIMENRLISMDPDFIKQEQIIFLGDIINSSRDLQLDKILKLKNFILAQINKEALGEANFSKDQLKLLGRYLKLFNSKIRDCAFYKQSLQLSQSVQSQVLPEIQLDFESGDLDNVVTLMSKCSDGSQTSLFNALTEFALILLLPPKPLVNKTIEANDYALKLLKEDSIQSILFCSIMASTNETVIQNILSQGKIDHVLSNIKGWNKESSTSNQVSDIFQYSQILHNCSKQPSFREKYHLTMSYDLYNFLKDGSSEEKGSLLRPGLSETTIQILVDIIRFLVVESEPLAESFSTLLKADIIDASNRGDVEFINKVIVPILHSEVKIPITISTVEEQSLKSGKANLKPIYLGTDAARNAGGQDNFFLRTSILNKKQKTKFGEMFKQLAGDKVQDFQKLVSSKWDLVFEDKAHQNQNPAKFKTFVKAVNGKENVIIFVQCKVQDQQVVFGGFTNKNFPQLGDTWAHEFDYQIPFSEANFVCYYTPDKELHYTMTHNKGFGYIYTDYEEGGALSISGDFFLISWSYEFQNSCGNIYDMKCIEDAQPMSFYNNMEIQHIEIWCCDIGKKSTLSEGKIKSELKKNPLYKPLSPFNFFRQNIVFEVSKNMTLSHVAQEILGKQFVFVKYPGSEIFDKTTTIDDLLKIQSITDSQILDLVVKVDTPASEGGDGTQKPIIPLAEDQAVVLAPYSKNQPLLKKFEEKGGIFDLIKAAKAAVNEYKSDKLKEMWSLWLNEIESFSQLPSFFSNFCQDREKEVIIYNLIEGKYDLTDSDASSPQNVRFIQNLEELHINMVKYSYKIVSEVFEKHESADLRDQCLKNGTFERFIERIGQLSSEKKRVKVDLSNKKEEEIISSPEKAPAQKDHKKKGGKKKDEEKKKEKRKGVGYTTGVGTVWNVSEYLKSKEAKSSQAANIVNILKHMIKSKDWEAPPEIKTMLLESALLPTLEAAFRSGSLLDMAKEYELNMSYLGFVQELANHHSLLELVMEIGEEYEPKQKQPIYQLLTKMNELSTIFLSCLTEESKKSMDEEQVKPRNLAEKIQETNKIVQEKVKESNQHRHQQSVADILSLPLSEAYWKLLSPMRFDYMNMKNSSGTYNHVFQADLYKGLNPPVTKLVRLAQEIADLSNSLPCDHTNAIFCRVDKERVDVMKCMIMGASGTPYAHGAFLYDLFFENTYPNGPPKVQLVTTGGQTVRFNPNLYNNGKVCLSLLGTWRGQSTENWDAKVSTILQVLLSIQAIIMSNEVYFNEPGYEHEAGTTDGERKNDGYSNIVRYCNVKFGMIDAIKNPPAGFEKIIKSSFYLKKNEVLREVKEWVDKAKTSDALYTGLTYDHNYHWAPQLSPEGKYAEMMEAIYKELKETLEALPSPFEDEGKVVERKFSDAHDDLHEETKKKQNAGTVAKIEDIDVSYEPVGESQVQNEININDDKVKDRWSRYIGAMGIEAVAKQAESRILISGLGPLGVEIAKNIVLAGCKELILYDDIQPIQDELSGQFFITENDIKTQDYIKTRAHYSKDKLQQLNFYVKVTVIDQTPSIEDYIKEQKDLKVVVLTDLFQHTTEKLHKINEVCREHHVAFINAYQNGLFSKVFTDFGPDFLVLDKDGEEMQEVMLKNIAYDDSRGATVVTLLEGFKHKYQDGDTIQFREVLGMKLIGEEEETQSINEKQVTIKVINPQSFTISDDARLYTKYEGNGIAKQVKVPLKLSFKSLTDLENENEPPFDSNLHISDFEKIDNKVAAHYIYQATMQRISADDYYDDDQFKACETTLTKVKEIYPGFADLSEVQQKKVGNLTYIFTLTSKYSFPPIAAFLGGVVSQEIVKAITQKFTPINQLMYFDCAELYHEQDILALDEEGRKELVSDVDSGDRYFGLKQILGSELFEEIRDCRVFMIGAGAIGCELLKNYAMIGLGTGPDGKIIVTDPDVIEVSNLNRQFLFREKHLRKPKSQTAAAAAIQMNPHLKNHIEARLDKIHDGTAQIYNEDFFQEQSIVTNALDNVQARLYIDGKCVAARTPLIDSGTLGPKGHVQVVIPDLLTESYASQRDPDDNAGEIPHCTLKMFPEETLHCVEWAKDLFGNLFTLQPQSFNKVVVEEKDVPVNFADQQEKAAIKKVIKIAEKRPVTFENCLQLARLRFQKHFVNDIKQLLHVYPLDKLTKEGRPFWSLPKRPPHAVEFDPETPLHQNLIASLSCLLATLFGINIPFEKPRSQEAKYTMAQQASQFEVPEFVPNDQKASQIESQVDKEKQHAKENGEDESEEAPQLMTQAKPDDVESLKKKFNEIIAPLRMDQSLKLKVEEFEKDNDDNYHVDFIHAMANIRAANYKLEEMDWITVKIKAGRIVPALATTTAAIAGLQTIELIKLLKDCKLEEHRNSFLNLAVPSLMMSEPAPAKKIKIGSGESATEVTLWDRWEYDAPNRNVTLLKLVDYLEETYKLSVRDIFYGSIPLFMHALALGNKDKRKEALDSKPLVDQTHPGAVGAERDEVYFIDLTVTFVDPKAEGFGTSAEKVLEGVPTVRVNLPQVE